MNIVGKNTAAGVLHDAISKHGYSKLFNKQVSILVSALKIIGTYKEPNLFEALEYIANKNSLLPSKKEQAKIIAERYLTFQDDHDKESTRKTVIEIIDLLK